MYIYIFFRVQNLLNQKNIRHYNPLNMVQIDR